MWRKFFAAAAAAGGSGQIVGKTGIHIQIFIEFVLVIGGHAGGLHGVEPSSGVHNVPVGAAGARNVRKLGNPE